MPGTRATVRLTLAFAVLLAALSLVIWRQSRALETLRALDRVRHERAVVEAERSELIRRIQELESRGRVVDAAGRELGMHVPGGTEIVILSVAGRGALAGAVVGDSRRGRWWWSASREWLAFPGGGGPGRRGEADEARAAGAETEAGTG